MESYFINSRCGKKIDKLCFSENECSCDRRQFFPGLRTENAQKKFSSSSLSSTKKSDKLMFENVNFGKKKLNIFFLQKMRLRSTGGHFFVGASKLCTKDSFLR